MVNKIYIIQTNTNPNMKKLQCQVRQPFIQPTFWFRIPSNRLLFKKSRYNHN